MKVMYDISVLGMGSRFNRARTGIYRVIENLLLGLVSTGECEIYCYSGISNRIADECSLYLKSDPRISSLPLQLPPFLQLSRALEQYQNVELPNFRKVVFSKDKELIRRDLQVTRRVTRKLGGFTLRILNRFSSLSDVVITGKMDLFHSTYYYVPRLPLNPAASKILFTVYDLVPILHPHLFMQKQADLVRHMIGHLTEDDWVVCISEATKNDLCNHADVNPERVFVIPLAASDEHFYPTHNAEEAQITRRKYKIPAGSYILSLNTVEPRKNIAATLDAFALLVQQEGLEDLSLVLVGERGWKYENLFERIKAIGSLADRIVITGYVPDEDLAALYSGALVFVYPTLYEGFGLPPLEAMQCGVPVITSNTSSLPEVVGDAGIMIAPDDFEGMCQNILDIYYDSSLRESLSTKSIERARQFSWERSTETLINVYRTVVAN